MRLLDIVTGMYHLLISFFILYFLLIFMCFILGSFFVNGISALVLFDSEATQYFLSFVLSKMFAGASRELCCPLDIEIVDDRSVWVSRVHQGCVLQMFSEQYPIDLVPIPLRGNKFIVGMDWLSPNRTMINYEHQLVRIRTPSGGELVVQGERAQYGSILCLAARVRRYLHQGCSRFIAYVMDT